MNRLLYAISFCYLLACGNGQTEDKGSPDAKDTISATKNQEEASGEGMPIAVETGKRKLDPGPVSLEDGFHADSALHLFFPGKYTELDGGDESYMGIWWKCESCERIPLYYNYFIEPEIQGWFPDSSFNTSVILSDSTIELPGITYRLLSFFHTNEPGIEFTGRFMGAPSGAALFVKKGDRFVLENFQAVLGAFGSFRTPNGPGLVRVGENKLLLDFNYGNGGPGTEYTVVQELFLPERNGFKRVFFDRFLFCSNTCMGDWESKMETVDSVSHNSLYDLQITTEGWVDGKCVDETEDEGNQHYFNTASEELKAKVKAVVKTKEKFNFKLTRVFQYNGSAYTCIKSETDFF